MVPAIQEDVRNMYFENDEFCPLLFKANIDASSIFIDAFVNDLVILSETLSTSEEIVNKLRDLFENICSSRHIMRV